MSRVGVVYLHCLAIRTPREESLRARATSESLRARAADARRRSAEPLDEAAVLVAMFESVLLEHYNSVDHPRQNRQHDRDLADLRVRAQAFGRKARFDARTPEEMLVTLKSALAEAAPEVRVLNRDVLSHQVTRYAIEGYYSEK